jgi:hypothetical protein
MSFFNGFLDFENLVITNLLGFTAGTIPFTYLGCPIFVGKPRAIQFQAMADRIKVKLATWKGSLLFHYRKSSVGAIGNSWNACLFFSCLSVAQQYVEEP